MGSTSVTEPRRLAALRRYHVLDMPPDPALDELTTMAARVFRVPMACVTLVREHSIRLTSAHGLEACDVDREPGLCDSALDVDGVLHLRDASVDPVASKSSVVGGGVRFYAGTRLLTPTGEPLGTFCVMGDEPRDLSDDEAATLQDFARLSMRELERYRSSIDLERTQEALRESEERFRVIFEQAAVGIAQVGVDGRWWNVNNRLCEIVGYERDELRQMTFQDITHPDDLDTNLRDLRRAIEGELDTYSIDKRYIRKDGETVWIDLTVSLVRDASDVPLYFISVVEDISERKRAEAALRRSEERLRHAQKLESLGVLAGGIAHDFNNLLVGVLGNAGLVLSRMTEESPSFGEMRMIEDSARRASDLTSQMLAYSGKGKLEVGLIDLNELVTKSVDLLGMAVAKNVQLTYDLAADPVDIEGDATQFRQVLMNLVSNASDAIGDEEGTIGVSTGIVEADREYLANTYLDDGLAPGVYAYLEVSDTGSGIDDKRLTRIFEPFFSTKFTGRGLGLAVVLGIVRSHEGAIRIDTKPGRGTTFRLLVPCVEAPADVLTPAPRGALPNRPAAGTILVVDDEAVVRAVAKKMLEGAGFEVITATDGVDALRVFRQHADDIDGVLLDVTMPRQGGERTFRELRAINPDTPIVFSSGYNQQTLDELLAANDSVYFVKKPYSPSTLIEALSTAVGA